jgi:uncharacterized protein YbaP (TraB family)
MRLVQQFCSALFALLLFQTALAQKQTAPTAPYELLWEITKPGMEKPSYLFGTYHTENRRLFHFSDSVLICLDNVDAYAMEVHPDSIIQSTYQQLGLSGSQLQYAEQQSNRDTAQVKIPDHLANKSAAWVRRNYMPEYIPSKMRHSCIIDIHLYDLARRHGKSIAGLESPSAKASAEDDTEREAENQEHALDLEASLRSHAELFTNLQNAYYNGDIKKVNEVLLNAYGTDTAAYAAMFTRRNHTLADSIERLVNAQSTFISIACGQLAGEDNLIELLREKGFTVRPVRATFTKDPWKYTFKSPETPVPVHELKDTELGILVKSPGQFVRTNFGLVPGSKAYATQDLPSGLVYTYASMILPSEQLDMDKDMMLVQLAYHFASRFGMQVQKLQDRTIGAEKGKEVILYGTKSLTYMHLALFLREHDLFMVILASSNPSQDAKMGQTFFDEMDFFEPERAPITPYEESQHGFSEKWYGKPYYTSHVGSWDDDTWEITTWDHEWSWYNLVNGVEAKVIITHSANSREYYDYEDGINNYRRSVLANPKNTFEKFNNLPGLDAYKATFTYEKRIVSESVVFFHQGRFFELSVSYRSGEYKPNLAMQFWEGFALSQPSYVPFTTHSDMMPGFSIQLPRYVEEIHLEKKDNIGSLEECLDAKRWRVRAEASNYYYGLEWQKLSPYQYFANEDSLAWRELRAHVVIDTASHFQLVKKEEAPEAKYYLFEKKLLKSDMALRCKVAISGEEVWSFVTVTPSNLEEGSPFLAPLRDFKVPQGKARTGKPLDLILQNFEDQERTYEDRHNAMDALLKSGWDKAQIMKLLDACSLTYPDETSGPPKSGDRQPFYTYSREALFALMGMQDTLPQVFPKIREMYDDLPQISTIRMTALMAMSVDSSAEAVDDVCKRMLAEKAETWKDFGYMHELCTDFVITKMRRSRGLMEAAAPSLVNLMKKPGYGKRFTSMAVACIDSGFIQPSQLESYRQEWSDSAAMQFLHHTKWVKKSKVPDHLQQYTYPPDMRKYVNWLGHLPANSTTTSALKRYASSKFLNVQLEAVIALLRSGQKVEDEKIEFLAGEDHLRDRLHEKLKDLKMEDRLPAKYRTQPKVAVAQLAAAVDSDNWPATEVGVLADRLFLDEKGNAVRVYLLSFGWSAEELYVGYAGPFSEDSDSLECDGAFTYTSYRPLVEENGYSTYWDDLKKLMKLKSMD